MAETQNLEEERMLKMIEKVKAMEEGRTKSESMMENQDLNSMMKTSGFNKMKRVW